MRKKIACIFISLFLVIVILSNVNAFAFNSDKIIVNNVPIKNCDFIPNEIIDDIGWFTSLVFDTNNFPHISYYDYTNGDLKYAKWTGTDWIIESIDTGGNVGRYTSIALNNENHPHISYYDYTNGDLKYAYWTGSSWSIKKVDGDGKVGLYTSIALDSSGLPHISYCDYTKRALKYAHWDGNSWRKKIVDNTGTICIFEYFGDYTSIAIDSKDNAHISYCDNGNFDLKYAYQYDSTWGIEVVDSNGQIGQYSSIVIDSNDNPHICYGDLTNDRFDLKYAVKTNDIWNIEKVDSDGDIRKWISLKLDTLDHPHISYYDYYEGSLKYTFYDGENWIYDTVEYDGSTGCFNSLWLDSDNNPYISYYDWGSKALKYASLSRNGWNIQTIEIDTNSDFLDQEQKYCCGYAFLIDDIKPVAQAFKPSYKALTRVELMIVKRYNPGGINVSIREDLEGNDLTSIYLSAKKVAEDLSWKNFDFPDIEVTSNKTYYIVCTTFDVVEYDAFYWYFGIYDAYLDGESWIKTGNWKKFSISGFPFIDFGFKTFGLDTQLPSNPQVDGPTHGKIGTELVYTLNSTDPDGDDISYCIDWGDKDIEYTNFIASGQEITVAHTWNKIKNYLLQVKAIDIHGAESGWTSIGVNIPRDKIFFKNPFIGFLERLFEFPIFQKIFTKIFL